MLTCVKEVGFKDLFLGFPRYFRIVSKATRLQVRAPHNLFMVSFVYLRGMTSGTVQSFCFVCHLSRRPWNPDV